MPATHPRKRNTQGYYWFSQLSRHIWFESMEEYSALMYLDYSTEVVGVAAQPMRLDFDTKFAHFPDYFVAYADGQAGPMNVRPAELIDDRAEKQFAATREVCDRVGWTYRTFGGLTGVERFSLEWIAAYRHERHAPSDDVSVALRELIGDGAAFGQIWSFARRVSHPYVLAGLYHQMWRREVLFDLEVPLEMNTWLRNRAS